MHFSDYLRDEPEEQPKPHVQALRDDVFGATVQGVQDIAGSFAFSIKQPIVGLSEIADHITGSHLSKAEWLNSGRPEPAPFASTRFWLQQTGSTLGGLPWFSLLHKVVGVGFKKTIGANVMETMTTRQLTRLAAAESMVTGFTYGTFLHPSRKKDLASLSEFTVDRLLTGTTTAATAGFSSYTSGKITESIGRPPTVSQKIATSFVSSGLSGGLDSEFEALRKHGRLANQKELARGAYTWAVLGAGMTAVHEFAPITKSHALKERDASLLPEERIARKTFEEFADKIHAASLRGEPEAAVMRLGAVEPGLSNHHTPETLSGAARIVFDRSGLAGFKPQLREIDGIHEIRLPLTGLSGEHPLMRDAIRAIERAQRERTR